MENKDETGNTETGAEQLKARLVTANQGVTEIETGIANAKQTVDSFVLENKEEVEKIRAQAGEVKTLLSEAKQSIADLKSSADIAKHVITTVEAYNKKLAESQELFDDPNTGISANHSKAQAKKNEIDDLKTASDTQLTEIKKVLVSVQENIRLMNEAYTSFQTVNTQVTHTETGLGAIHTQAIALKNEIEVLKTSSTIELEQIKTTLTTVQESVQVMTETYTSFLEIKAKIDDPEMGLQKTLEISEATKQETIAVKKASEALYIEIKKFRDYSSGYTKDIEEIKKTSEVSKTAIIGYEAESRDFKNKIQDIFKFATDGSLAHAFDTRKNGLQKTTNQWFIALWVSTAILSISLVLLLRHLIWYQVDSIDGYTWYRLTLTSPLIFFVTFASIQYSKERALLEKYAFKAATALSLESYTTLLINTFGKEKEKNEQEILGFVLMSMSSIYEEPYEKTSDSKFSFDVNGKFATIKGTFAKKATEETKKAIVKTVKEAIDSMVETPE